MVKQPKFLLTGFRQFLQDNLCKVRRRRGAYHSCDHTIALHVLEIGPGTGAVTMIYMKLLSDIISQRIILCGSGNHGQVIGNSIVGNIKDGDTEGNDKQGDDKQEYDMYDRSAKSGMTHFDNHQNFRINIKLLVHVYFVELDPGMLQALKENIRDFLSQEINRPLSVVIKLHYIHKDATKISLQNILDMSADNVKNMQNLLYIFGALPYNVSKNIIIHVAQEYNILQDLLRVQSNQQVNHKNKGDKQYIALGNNLLAGFTYIIQKEVAQAFIGKPLHASLLSNILQLYTQPGSVKIVQRLGPAFFNPPPKVDSAILIGYFQEFKEVYTQILKSVKQKLVYSKGFTGITDTKIIKVLKLFARYPRKTIGKIAIILAKNKDITNNCKQFIIEHYSKNRFAELRLQDWLIITSKCTD